MSYRLDGKTHISPDIINLLPGGLLNIEQVEDLQERDIYLLAAIVGLSTCMPHVKSEYRGKDISPHHYLYVTGPPESGKCAINIAKAITLNVNWDIYQAYLERKEYYENQSEDEKVPKPILNKLYITDDTTSAAFVRSLTVQHDAGSLLVSPEAGTLAKSLAREHGGFLGQLLKAWEHEVIDKDLMQHEDYDICEFPKLSLALASNVKDFHRLLGEASSTGLLSRLLMYTTRHVKTRLGIVGSFKYASLVEPLKDHCLGMFRFLSQNYSEEKPCKFQLTETQVASWEIVINKIDEAIKQLSPSIDFGAKRFSMSIYRQLMVISVYRAYCEGRISKTIAPIDADFSIAIDLACLQASHLLGIYDQLPDAKKMAVPNIFFILKELPTEFKSGDFYKKVTDGGPSRSTAKRSLLRLQSLGLVYHMRKENGEIKMGWMSKKKPSEKIDK